MLHSYSNVILPETESLSSHTSIAASLSRRKTNCTQTQSLRSDVAKAYCSTVRLRLILSFENSMPAPCSPPPYDDEGGGVG